MKLVIIASLLFGIGIALQRIDARLRGIQYQLALANCIRLAEDRITCSAVKGR